MTTTLIQLSDTHLSHQRGFFVENFQAAIAALAAAPADLTVISGDLSLDGADSEDDLAFSSHMFGRLPGEVLTLPGNHDVGEEPGAGHTDQPVTPGRLARYLARFGTDRFCRDVPGWRLIGLNVHLFGTGWAEEQAQASWLEDKLSGRAGRAVGLFLHKPLFISDRDEPADQSVCVPEAHRAWLLDLAGAGAIGFVASGHLHQGLQREFGGVRHIWCPSTAFSASEPRLPAADPALGAVRYSLHPDGTFESAVTPLAGLAALDYNTLKENGKYPFLKDVPPRPAEVAWPP